MLGISLAVLLVMMGWTLCLGSVPTLSPVFRSGTEGYHTFRIPAIVRGTNGVLLAFAEGRKNSASDTGDIDLVLKRSADNGSSWEPIQVVSEDGANTVGNPTPLVDSLSGKVWLLTTRNAGNVTEAQVRLGLVQDRRVFIQESADNGVTWSAPRQITAQVKRDDWRCYATGPGHGIQLTRGGHAGRLIAPCDHTTANATDWSACGAHLIYSDDHGTTWRIGADGSPDNGWINPNECSAVELVDGKVYTLARDQEGSAPGNRAFAFSSDAGGSFDTPFAIETNLVSPVVQGALLRWSAIDQGGQTNRLLFSAPAHPSERRTMCIRSSFDESRTWSTAKTIYDGPSAYSDMVRMGNERVGLLFECGVRSPYECVTFAVIGIDFLDASHPPRTGAPRKN